MSEECGMGMSWISVDRYEGIGKMGEATMGMRMINYLRVDILDRITQPISPRVQILL